MQLFRIEPKLPPSAMQTYAITQPRDTHTREATCAEVNCAAQRSGWITNVDTSTELGRKQSYYIRVHSGRRFSLSKAGEMETFEFPAGERCFAGHRVSLDRPANFLKIPGDHRHFVGDVVKLKPEDWVDDFAEHQDKIISLQRRG